ncbi:cell wall surface anchor family protein, partial [Listeria ivanovii FSL F6-596]
MTNRTKRNSLKKLGLMFLSIILFLNVTVQTSNVKAATSYGSDFLKTVELQDTDGNESTDFGYRDDIKVHYTWEIPNSVDVKAGDTMDFTLPSDLVLRTNLQFDLKTDNGDVVGTVVAIRDTGKVTITFSDYVENNSDIKGSLDFWAGFNFDTVSAEGDDSLSLDFPLGGGSDEIVVVVDPLIEINPNETAHKYGYVDSQNPELIHWSVRVNYAKTNIENAVYEDFIGPDQVLNFDSVRAYHGDILPDNTFINSGNQVPASNFVQTDRGFKVTLGDLTDTVKITYTTTATDGGTSDSYSNSGVLTGDNYTTKEITNKTPFFGGNGDGDGTNGSVVLTKTDDSAQKNPLEGAEFQLVNSTGDTIQEGLTTDSDGKITISQLKYGTYQLVETK